MALSGTARTILGMLAICPMSGYEIKQLADVSVRHFWNLSYGQIYPELRDLVAAGLVEVEAAPTGARQRQTHSITERGREELMSWLGDPERLACEIRDGMLLKLFFSDALPLGPRLALVDGMRRRHEEMAQQLRAVEPMARSFPEAPMKLEILGFGIGLHTWCAQWCADLAERLRAGEPTEER